MNQKSCTWCKLWRCALYSQHVWYEHFFSTKYYSMMSIQKKNIVLYAKRGKQGRVEEYFALDRVKVNCNEGLGSKLLIKLPFA